MRGEKGDAADGGGTSLITPAQARERGLGPDPPEARCPHCGRVLEARGVIVGGRVAWVSRERCACRGAKAAEEEARREESERTAREREARIARCGIGRRFRSALPTDVACASFAASYRHGGGEGLYIHGKTGVGKTSNAAGVAIALLDRGETVAFATSVDLLGSIQDTFDGGTAARTSEVRGRYLNSDVLVLDDLGKEKQTAWTVTTLYALVNARYEEMRSTLITSQYTMDELEARLARRGEAETARAIVSRIRQTCEDVWLTGPDMRRTHAASPPRMRRVYDGIP